MVEFRAAIPTDTPQIMELAAEFHKRHVIYKDLQYENDDVVYFIQDHILSLHKDILVAVENDQIVGLLCVSAIEMFFGTDTGAYETTFYVSPRRTNGHVAKGLLKSFETWARNAGASFAMISITSGLLIKRTQELLEAFGYENTGANMVLKL